MSEVRCPDPARALHEPIVVLLSALPAGASGSTNLTSDPGGHVDTPPCARNSGHGRPMTSRHHTWFDRHRAGHCADVWHEIRQLGAHLDPEQRAAAQLVSDEMAKRARRNVEVLVGQLTQEGYLFHSNDDRQADEVPFLPCRIRCAAPSPMA